MRELTTVLFTRSDSIYRDLECDCWDMWRDARLLREREAAPLEFAKYLISIVELIKNKQ